MNRVAIYCRLSDEDRNKQSETDESESIQNQKSMLTKYCKEQNWDIFKIYCDEDYSGADNNRPDFKEMLQACEERMVDIVLCKSQSRFSRDMEVIEKYIHNKFIEWGVRFVSIIDHADTSVAGNKKARQINGLINEWYLEDLSENVRRTFLHKRLNGEFTGSFAPYGYLRDPMNKNHLIIDENVAFVVRKIFTMYAEGFGYNRICSELNSENIPTPSTYKESFCGYRNMNREKSAVKNKWTVTTVYRMLRNEFYTGTLVQGKTHHVSYKNKTVLKLSEREWIKCHDTHEAIIDRATWDRVQAKFGGVTRVKTDKCGELSPLSGKVRCAVCGSGMYKSKRLSHDGTKMYSYLSCRARKHDKSVCDNDKCIRLDKLEEIVLDRINELLEQYYDPSLIKYDNGFLKRQQSAKEEINSIKKNLERKQIKLEALYEDKSDGIITREEFAKFSTACRKEMDVLKGKIDELEMILQQTENKENRKAILEKYKHIEKLTRNIADEFVVNIEVGKIVDEEREITVCWKV